MSLVDLTIVLLFTLVGIIGLVIGSFLNVVVYRVPHHLSIVKPASHCPSCGYVIPFWQNIPVLSWVLLRAKCYHCHAQIAWRYPALEILGALVAMFVFWKFGLKPALLPALIFTWCLLALSWIDLETQLLPNVITKPFMVLGLLVNGSALFVHGWSLTTPEDALLGWAAGYAILWLLSEAYRRATGKYGMGGGDLKLLSMMGAWLGLQAVFMTLWIAAVTGGIVAIGYLIAGRQKDYALPFGPYLALGGWVMLLWPHALINDYLKLLH